MSYWAEFAYKGAPGKGRDGTEVAWLPWQPPVAQTAPRLMVLDTANDRGIRMVPDMLTVAALKEAFLADSSYEPEAKCLVYERSFSGEDFDEDEFNSMSCQ